MKTAAFFLLLLIISCQKQDAFTVPNEYKGTWYKHVVIVYQGGPAYNQNYYNPAHTLIFEDDVILEDNGSSAQIMKWHIEDIELLYPDSSYYLFKVWRRYGNKKGELKNRCFKMNASNTSFREYQYNDNGTISYYGSGYEKAN